MKTRLQFSFVLALLLALMFTSCASKEESEKAGKEFYEALKVKDYDKAMSLFDEAMFEEEGKENILNFITQKEALGEMKSYTLEPDSKWMERNGRSMVRLLYTVKHEQMTLYEYIVFSKTDNGYKIVNYAYYDSKEKRQEYISVNED